MESCKADEKQRDEVESEERRYNSAKVRKKIHPRQMLEVAKCCVFPMVRVSAESKSKAAGAESCGQRRNQKLHAAVARSTFPSQNVQNTSGPDRFLKFGCRKIARHSGAKRISKSKFQKS